jgi:hypothetical protein
VAESELQALTFPTDGLWFASDLARLVEATEQLYGAFRVARVYARRLKERWPPRDLDLIEEELWRHRKPPFSPSEVRLLRTLLFDLRGQEPVGGYYSWVTANIDLLDERGRLRLGQAQMASRGVISFEGSGEIIREIREFIKDLCGRNRQEREKAAVEIEREQVKLQKDSISLAATSRASAGSPQMSSMTSGSRQSRVLRG